MPLLQQQEAISGNTGGVTDAYRLHLLELP